MRVSYDVVILGAGHNGLVAASYLGRAGLSVLLLEKNDYIGGATTSQQVFPDYDARLSRYSYLVSLFPEQIIRELGLKLELRRRETASFTPYQRDGQHHGLLLSNVDRARSRASLRALTGSDIEFDQMERFYALARLFAEKTWDGMLQPLLSRRALEQSFQDDDLAREAWRSLVEEPIGVAIERYFRDDLVRGLVLTDAKIGIHSHAHDRSLVQNRCFLYHLIGNCTGEWKVPVGGMGAVARVLEESARAAGAEMQTSVRIEALDVSAQTKTVRFTHEGRAQTVEARYLLANFGRNILAKLTGIPFQPDRTDEGSVFKMNLLLRRLPRLKATGYTAAEAFGGTFHSDEGYGQMQESYEQANSGLLPANPPGETYCHTLTDDSILSPQLRAEGFHTLTLFGLDMPWSLFAHENDRCRAEAQRRYLASLDQWLDEPLADCLALAKDGRPCVESKTPVDLEDSLGMFRGNIFHDAPTWPFAAGEELAGTWGVETEWDRVYLCGSSAQRGGAVSGIPGHNAALKVLEDAGLSTR